MYAGREVKPHRAVIGAGDLHLADQDQTRQQEREDWFQDPFRHAGRKGSAQPTLSSHRLLPS